METTWNGDNTPVETIALERFFSLLVINYVLVVPLFYVNLLGKSWLRTIAASSLIRLLIISVINLLLLIVLTRITIALQSYWLSSLVWIERLQGLYLFRNFIILSIVLLTVYIIELFQRSQRMYRENIQLREENTKTQLGALKAQLNPHFLFNALNTLTAVIRTDQEESLQFVQKLSEVFRYILQSNQQDLTTVGKELQFLEAYLFMLQKRFGHKLLTQLQVNEQVHHYRIPPLALQILVENAVKHNTITAADPLTITIMSTDTTLIVSNNRQAKRALEEHYGIGLANLNQRYQLIVQQSISVTKSSTKFTVTLPLL